MQNSSSQPNYAPPTKQPAQFHYNPAEQLVYLHVPPVFVGNAQTSFWWMHIYSKAVQINNILFDSYIVYLLYHGEIPLDLLRVEN